MLVTSSDARESRSLMCVNSFENSVRAAISGRKAAKNEKCSSPVGAEAQPQNSRSDAYWTRKSMQWTAPRRSIFTSPHLAAADSRCLSRFSVPLLPKPQVLDELVRERERLAHRHVEADEVFGNHGFGSVENRGRSVRTLSERAAVFVLLSVIDPSKSRHSSQCCSPTHGPRLKCRLFRVVSHGKSL